MNIFGKFIAIFLFGVLSVVSAVGADNFSVNFTNCVESIGVTLVPTAVVRPFIPTEFIPVGEGQPVTPLVVRSAKCEGIATAGHTPKPGEIVQIGAVIVPPDFTGDINNYTIWYYTSEPLLAIELRKMGVNAQIVPTIEYNFNPAQNMLNVQVPLPASPRLSISGTVNPSPAPAGSFTANWWQKTSAGKVKMSTNVPVISIGGANLVLTTDPNNPLGQLIGGNSTGFPIIQQFNGFTTAQMNVTAP